MSTDNTNQTDIVRVLRVVEYTGPREWVEATVARSIHGKRIMDTASKCVIRAATIGEFPEILERATPRETECAMENDHMCALHKKREAEEEESKRPEVAAKKAPFGKTLDQLIAEAVLPVGLNHMAMVQEVNQMQPEQPAAPPPSEPRCSCGHLASEHGVMSCAICADCKKTRLQVETELTLCGCGHPLAAHGPEGCFGPKSNPTDFDKYCDCILSHGRCNHDPELTAQL